MFYTVKYVPSHLQYGKTSVKHHVVFAHYSGPEGFAENVSQQIKTLAVLLINKKAG